MASSQCPALAVLLRPGVRFHNGNLLVQGHITASITALAALPLFSHIEKVDSPKPLVLDIYLNRDDWHLPLLFTESCAKVLPPSEWISTNGDLYPIGTGLIRLREMMTNDWC